MKIVAAYRMYYGEDFIKMSIDSIYDHVDKILVFWTDRPWGNVIEAKYRGEIIKIPQKIDFAVDIVEEMISDGYEKIELIYNSFPTSMNLLTVLYNQWVDKSYNHEEGNVLLFIEHDMLFDRTGIDALTRYINENRFEYMYTPQIEFWKTHKHAVKQRGRPGVIVYDLRERIYLPATEKNCMPRGSSVENTKIFDHYTYNFGFCLKPRNMYWKIIVCLAFTTVVHDSIPDENWYEDTWLAWDYETNNKDLEISKNYRSDLPYAEVYNGPLPEVYLNNINNAG